MKYNIRYYLHPVKRKDGYSISLSLTWANQRLQIYLPWHVEQKMWDKNRQQCKPNWRDAAFINRQLTQMKKNLQDFFYEKGEKFEVPTKDDIRKILGLNQDEKNNDGQTFEEVFNIFIQKEQLMQQWSPNTKKNLLTVKTDFHEYRPGTPIAQIDENIILGFLSFLQNKGLTNLSVDSILRKFRRFMKWAFENKYTPTDIGFTLQPKLHYAFDEPIYLNPDEIKKVANCNLPVQYRATRDVFIFCCFSGLRYSDVKQLRKTNIHEDYFEIITEKTNDSLKIELNDYSKGILEKYKNIKGDFALPVLSNQSTNLYLKAIGEMAGLNRMIHKTIFLGNERIIKEMTLAEALTFHVARKTFITMALYLDIQPAVFMKWTGHKSFNTLKRYLGIVDKMKEESMKKFNSL